MVELKMKMSPFLLLFLFVNPIHCFWFPVFINPFKSWINKIFNWWGAIKSPKEFFYEPIRRLVEVVTEFLFDTVNIVCSEGLLNVVNKERVYHSESMFISFMGKCFKTDFDLDKINLVVEDARFNASNRVVIVASGWTTSVSSSQFIKEIVKAYSCRGRTNVLALDASDYLDTMYLWASYNYEEVGKHLGYALAQLSKSMNYELFHLIGHSLGAHIVGAAARYFEEKTGKQIARVTGLDPAKPCFGEAAGLTGLQRGDAAFIDVIHSNSGVLGKREPIGDIDYYPGGMGSLPPGCLSLFCAHDRAWEYYVESVYPGNERSFKGKHCASMELFRENKCPGENIIMGMAQLRDQKGIIFLDVNKNYPYGKDHHELIKSHGDCGSCY